MYDAIIVGQGLAGTILYHSLLNNGYKVLIVDNGHRSSASQAAAGIYNPIIIKRLRKSWRGLEFIQVARELYEKIESKYGWNIHSSIPINRIFSSDIEYRQWEDKLLESGWESRIEISASNIQGKTAQVGVVKETGWLNIPELLQKSKDLSNNHDAFLEEQFEFNSLELLNGHLQYKDTKANRIFFCEGYKVSENPYFSHLPLSPVKGEILIIEDPGISLVDILHCGFFILPIGKHKYKVGATFSWDNLNETTTEESKNQLLEGILPYTSKELKVIDQIAGVRPAVVDRRPLIGTHSERDNLHIFNGLGTRGVMLAPFLAQNLIDHVYDNLPLVKEADISRFN